MAVSNSGCDSQPASQAFTAGKGSCPNQAGRILFANMQTPGITVAIAGPWNKGNL